jgi:hypothetical protein
MYISGQGLLIISKRTRSRRVLSTLTPLLSSAGRRVRSPRAAANIANKKQNTSPTFKDLIWLMFHPPAGRPKPVAN